MGVVKRRRVIGGLPGDYRPYHHSSGGVRFDKARETWPFGPVIGGLPGDYRRCSLPEKCHVDPVAGDDANDGSEDAPLRTFAELVRRVRSVVGLHETADDLEALRVVEDDPTRLELY